MTVSSTTNRKTFAGNGVTTSFGTSPVVFFNSGEMTVQVVLDSTGAATALTENTHYTVSGGAGSTGTINLAGGSAPYGAPAAGTTLVLLRVLPYTQTDDFVNNDESDAEVVEDRFDKLTMMAQQLNEVDARSIKLPAAETGSSVLTELPFDRASKFLAFDSSKNPIASSGAVAGSVPVSAFMETVLDDADAATARTTLGAGTGDVEAGPVTTSGLTMNTARMLGRTTASTGAVEEITVGSGLSLSAGSLSAPSGWTLGTAVATTSGSTVDFTGLPANVAEIVVMYYGVSTNANSNHLIQLGDSGGFESTGYVSGAWQGGASDTLATSTAGFLASAAYSNAQTFLGQIRILRFSGNKWSASGSLNRSDGAGQTVSGTKELSDQLTQLRITTVSADTFDAGEVNILYRVA